MIGETASPKNGNNEVKLNPDSKKSKPVAGKIKNISKKYFAV